MQIPPIVSADEPVPLQDVLITTELIRRPRQGVNGDVENSAFAALSHAMNLKRMDIPQWLVDTALTVCKAGSAGLSLLKKGDNGPYFEWRAIAGKYERMVGGRTPRLHSPCGACLDRGTSQLYERPARHFTYLAHATPPIHEGLVIPLYGSGNRPLGTLWVLSHDEWRKFNGDDEDLLTRIANYASVAAQILNDPDLSDRRRHPRPAK